MLRGNHLGAGSFHRLNWRLPAPFKVFAPGSSLRRRVMLSLAIVRLILVPVIILAVYYLFEMGWIVDRIVRVDAEVATLAESVSIQMLNARRMEVNYFLLHDPADLEASRQSLNDMEQTLQRCAQIQPVEKATTGRIQAQLQLYRQRLNDAVSQVNNSQQTPARRFQNVVRVYEKNLDDLLKRSRQESRARFLEELRDQSGSFDAQVAAALSVGDPALRQATQDLEASSNAILELSSALEQDSWNRVRHDHQDARRLVSQAEWALGSVSVLVIFLSILVSYVLPRQVVKPLNDLKAAVDHAAAGNYEIEFDVHGKGEVAQLAHSVRNLIAHVSEKSEESKVDKPV